MLFCFSFFSFLGLDWCEGNPRFARLIFLFNYYFPNRKKTDDGLLITVCFIITFKHRLFLGVFFFAISSLFFLKLMLKLKFVLLLYQLRSSHFRSV